jgi:hypothetical protein
MKTLRLLSLLKTKVLFILLTFSISGPLWSQTFEIAIDNPEDAISSLDDGKNKVTAHLNLAKFPVGSPNLTALSALIFVPNGMEVNITVNVGEKILYNDSYVRPVAPSNSENDHSELPDEAEYKNMEIYGSSSLFPNTLFDTSSIGKIRGRNVCMLYIYPFCYNPVDEITYMYDNMSVTITYSGNLEELPANLLAEFDSVELKTINYDPLENKVINYDQVMGMYLENSKSMLKSTVSYEEGCEYLIITKESLLSAAEKLRDHKSRNGISTKIHAFPNSQTVTPLDIESFIDNAYENFKPVPKYILLLGDIDLLPHSIELVNRVSDLPYFDIDDKSPRMADFSSGRVPISDLRLANIWVDKIIRYETIPINDDFFNNAALVSFFEPNKPGSAREQRRYIRTMEEMATLFEYKTMHYDRLYYSDQNNIKRYTSCPSYMMQGDNTAGFMPSNICLPNEVEFRWDKSHADIVNSFNNRRFLVVHRGHGNETAWGTSNYVQFNKQDVTALNNKDYPSVVWSINCLTGNFASSENCIAEQLLKHENGGAVSVVAATSSTETLVNDYLIHGMSQAIWKDFKELIRGQDYLEEYGVLRMGDILRYGLLDIVNTLTSENGDIPPGVMNHIYSYHLLGDPTLKIMPISGCEEYKEVENKVIGNGEEFQLDRINTIELKKGFEIRSGGKVSLAAGERIYFAKGFKAFKGGNLHAHLEPCPEYEPTLKMLKGTQNKPGTIIPKANTLEGIENNKIIISPNPSSGIITIALPGTVENAEISIYNQLGQEILELPNSQSITELNLENMPKGSYFIRANCKGVVYSSKFLLY